MRRAPQPYLRPQLDLCLPTGVELTEGKRVLVVESKAETGEPLAAQLASRKVQVLRLNAGLAPAAITEKIAAWLAEGPDRGGVLPAGVGNRTKTGQT